MRNTHEEIKAPIGYEDFQQQLLDHVEMVYSVALRMSGNPHDAELLTRITMSRIWHRHNTLPQTFELKTELLSTLRQAFLDKQRINIRVKTRWGCDPYAVDKPLTSGIKTLRKRNEKTEDAILAAAF